MSSDNALWFGPIPDRWSWGPLGRYFTERRETVSDQLFTPLSVTKDGIVPQLDTAAKTNDGDNRKRVAKGDFVINSRSDRKGSSGLSSLDGSVSVISTVITPRASLRPEFVHHLLRSAQFQEEYYRYGTGIVADLWSTRYSQMKKIPIPVPPVEEQRRIAEFLDRETAQIDELIAKQKQLISTLAERFAAETHAAVVAGLDQTDVTQLRHVAVVLDCKHVTAEFVEEGHPLASIGEIGGEIVELSRAKRTTREFYDLLRDGGRAPRPGDLIFTRNATVGNVSRVVAELEPFALGQDVCLIRADAARVDPEFLQAQLTGPSIRTQLDRLLIGSTFKRVNIEQIRGLRVFLPDLGSQKAAVDGINNSRLRTNSLISRSQSVIDLLRERRQALVSAAVTGKIDVGGAS